MTRIIGIICAVIALHAAWNSDFIAGFIFFAGAMFCVWESGHGRDMAGVDQ